jgi:hypothetical protein
MTLVVAAAGRAAAEAPGPERLREAYRSLVASGVGRKEALRSLAKRWSIPRREVYEALLPGGSAREDEEDSGGS